MIPYALIVLLTALGVWVDWVVCHPARPTHPFLLPSQGWKRIPWIVAGLIRNSVFGLKTAVRFLALLAAAAVPVVATAGIAYCAYNFAEPPLHRALHRNLHSIDVMVECTTCNAYTMCLGWKYPARLIDHFVGPRVRYPAVSTHSCWNCNSSTPFVIDREEARRGRVRWQRIYERNYTWRRFLYSERLVP